MTDTFFRDLWQKAQKAPDADSFAKSCDFPGSDLAPVKDQLSRLWHVAHDDFRDLLKAMQIRQTEMATHFCIPLRTVQGWALGERECSGYIRLMIAEATGYITLRR